MRALSCALLCALLRGQEAWDCPEVGCGYLGANATYTGRYAVFMAGRIRVAHAALQKLRPIIERRYSGAVRVDFFFHVWVNKTSLCERRTLDEFKALATAITVEPVECMWSWGTGGSANSFQNQWHGVDLAFQTLERFGRAEDYTLILKSRVDVSYSDLDLEALWRRYGNSSSAQAAGGHFAVLAISQGWDVHAAATPPLARAFAAYRRGSGFGCDSRSDSFPWQRFARHGCWMPPGDAAQGPGCGRGTKKGVDPRCTGAIAGQATPKHVRGRPPRCAPLFVDWIPSSIHRSHPYALNPDTEPPAPPPHVRAAATPRGVHAPGVGEAAEVVVRRAPPRRLLRLARRALSPLQPRACARRRRRKRDPRPRWARRLAPLVGPSGPFGSGPSRVVCIAAFQVAFPMLLDSPLRLLSPFLSRNSSASRQLPKPRSNLHANVENR